MFTKYKTMGLGRRSKLFVHRHLYAILLTLFSLILVYQTFYTTHVLDVLHSLTTLSRAPFSYSNSRVVTGLTPEASAAGVQRGDTIEKIDGREFTGDRILRSTLAETRPGRKLAFDVRNTDGNRRRLYVELAPLRRKPATARSWIFSVTAYIFMPICCLLLGLAVAAIRPAKLITWIVLALMMSLSCLQVLPGWNGPFDLGALVYQDIAQSTFGIWLVLFGIYFSPESRSQRRLGSWLKWLLVAPLALVSVFIALLDATTYLNFNRLQWLHRWAGTFQTAMLLLNVAAVIVFFCILVLKSIRASAHDVRRRLMVLWAGTALSFGPLAVVVVINLIRGEAVFENMPVWVVFPAGLMLTLFPVTLAYVILAHRALALRVLAREAVKQVFTPGGAVVLRLLVLGACFIAVAYVNTQATTRMEVARVVFLAAIFACFAQLPFAERLNQWFDRRIFREAYHSEKILRNLHSDIFRDNASLVRAVRRRVQRALRATQVTLFLRSGQGYRMASSVLGGGVPQTIWEMEGISNRLTRMNRPMLAYFDDPQSWVHELSQHEQQILRQVNTQLLLPLTRNRDLIGFLCLGPKRWDEAYSGSDLQLLLSLATQLSFALENIRLLEQLANEAAESERSIAEKQAAEQANQAKSAFLARMSHELRTPLNAIIGYSEMLQEDAIDINQPAFVADLEKIRSAGKHLLELINSVLDISKIEAGKMELHLQTIDVQELVREVVTMVQPVVEKNRNRFEVQISEDIGEMQTDATKLRQGLVNLIGNAGKFTEAGVVTLAVTNAIRDGVDWVRFQVRDTGIGITQEQLARLFQPFTQADASVTRKYGGTGLGLVITRRFCEMLGGHINVTSEWSKGSVFTIELPARIASSSSDATSEMATVSV